MNPTDDELKLRKRQLEAIKALDDDSLLIAYEWGWRNPNLDASSPTVKAVIEGRLSKSIVDGSKAIEKAVERLVESSDKLERLTVTLKWLTIVLVVLTFFAIVEPIGIEFWHAHHEPQNAPVTAPPPAPTPTPTP